MTLPFDSNLSISKLASVFKNTSATYKFYWFWAILEAVEQGEKKILKKDLFARMLTLSWYTVNYFNVSFGKQDLIQDAVKEVKELESLNVDSARAEIFKTLKHSQNIYTVQILNHFDNNVPHKFLSPWLGSGSKSSVYEQSLNLSYEVPYELHADYILINDNWNLYFKNNSGILKSFCFWNLTLFLQKRNPNVPDIANKIHRPITRNGLNKHKIDFWDIVLDELGTIECIYTGDKLTKGNYIIEHFIPYQFVAHDLMWNLIPAESSFNSKKRDKLPDFDIYFGSFYELQKTGIEIIRDKMPRNRFLEDYLTIFPNLELNRIQYESHIKPLLLIAHNNGFQYL